MLGLLYCRFLSLSPGLYRCVMPWGAIRPLIPFEGVKLLRCCTTLRNLSRLTFLSVVWFEFARLLLPFLIDADALADGGFIVRVFGWLWNVTLALLDSASAVPTVLTLFKLFCLLLLMRFYTVFKFLWLAAKLLSLLLVVVGWFLEDAF